MGGPLNNRKQPKVEQDVGDLKHWLTGTCTDDAHRPGFKSKWHEFVGKFDAKEAKRGIDAKKGRGCAQSIYIPAGYSQNDGLTWRVELADTAVSLQTPGFGKFHEA